MPRFAPHDVVLVDFPFTVPGTIKRRPGLVLFDSGQNDLVVARITSAAIRAADDVAMTDWQAAGLQRASTIRLARVVTFSDSVIIRMLGSISPRDASNVRLALLDMVDRHWP